MNRPPEMWSIVRAMSASRFGLRYELQITSDEISARFVSAAIAAWTVSDSKCLPFRSPLSGKK